MPLQTFSTHAPIFLHSVCKVTLLSSVNFVKYPISEITQLQLLRNYNTVSFDDLFIEHPVIVLFCFLKQFLTPVYVLSYNFS